MAVTMLKWRGDGPREWKSAHVSIIYRATHQPSGMFQCSNEANIIATHTHRRTEIFWHKSEM